MPETFWGWVALFANQYGPQFLKGAGTAVFLAVAGTAIGTGIGFLTGLVQTLPTSQGKGALGRWILWTAKRLISLYVWLFRGTPMMVQAMVIFYGATQLFGITLDHLLAGLFVVAVNTGAYMTETVRGGVHAVDPGQLEGAKAIGMSHGQAMYRVVIPQAFRNITPQIGNYFISNIKDTSVLSVIMVNELFYVTRSVSGQYIKYFEAFFVACVLYLILTTLATWLVALLERWMDGPQDYELAGDL